MQMEVRVVLKAASFICLVVVGIPANLTVLLVFCRLRVSKGRLAPNEFILGNLASSNLLVMLCRGIPQTLAALGMPHLFGDNGCKVVIFAFRISRAMSICTTALLSCYQAVTIAPATPRWAALKSWLPSHLPHLIVLLYGLNFPICHAAFLFPEAFPANGTIPEYTLNLAFCIVVFPDYPAYMAHGVIYIVRDFAFVCLMVAAGTYMVQVLYRHQLQVKDLRGAGRATAGASQAVLLLVSLYVVLFGLDNVAWVYTLCVSRVLPAISDTRVFFSSCYSAFSPVLIIATNPRLAGIFRFTDLLTFFVFFFTKTKKIKNKRIASFASEDTGSHNKFDRLDSTQLSLPRPSEARP